jgi:hypothetical protein
MLNYLDLTIINKENRLTFGIFRKPTTTDLIIHNDSCHPYEHKKSARNYLVNRMSKYPITKENRAKEKQTICNILKNNHYNMQAIYQKQKTSRNIEEKDREKTLWATFTYHGNDTLTITKLFKNTNLKIAYRTTNTIRKHLKAKIPLTEKKTSVALVR